MEKKWKVLETTDIFSTSIMKLKSQKCELPDGRIMPKYYIVDFPDWVHVVAVTEKGEVILVRQYRHAAQEFFWELPGGTLDDKNEDPLLAAKRELQEETGYTSSDWVCLGSHNPNPAVQTNRLHTYLARNCKKTHELNLDEFEDLEVQLEPYEEVERKLENAEFKHSLMMSSLVLAGPYLKGPKA